MHIHLPAPLVLDLGPVGFKEPREPYKISLQLDRLKTLLVQSQSAHRIAELMRIARPGDLLTYVDVHPQQLPKRIVQRLMRVEKALPPALRSDERSTNEPVAWNRFDAVHYTPDDDTDPEDSEWDVAKHSTRMRVWMTDALSEVLRTQRSMNMADPLIGHVIRQCLARQHPDDFLPVSRLSEQHHRCEPGRAGHTLEFYEQLARVLRDPSIGSVAYRGQGDYSVIRLLVTEQRVRGGNASGRALMAAFPVNALVNHPVRNDGWDSCIAYYDEGLGSGDLFIETDSIGGAPVGALFAMGYRQPSLLVYSSRRQTDLGNYDESSGPGWFLYRRRPTNAAAPS